MADFLDNCWWTAASGGTGDFVVASTKIGYRSFEAYGSDQTDVQYFARAGAQFERGTGIWTQSTLTLERAGIELNSNGDNVAVDFLVPPEIYVDIPASLMNTIVAILGPTYQFLGSLQIDSNGNITHVYAIADGSTAYVDVTNGFTETIGDNCSSYILRSAAALTSGTLNLPANPIPNQQLYLKARKGAIGLTVNGNGHGLVTPITAIAAGGTVVIQFDAVNDEWV